VIVGQSGLGQSTFFEHEVGTDQVNPNGTTTTVTSFIKSFDFDLQQRQRDARGRSTGPSIAGEIFLAVRRFVPDFKNLEGNAKVTLAVKRYPQQNDTVTSLSPFTINASTDKKDTRARGRFVNLKIENDSVSESWRFGTFRLDIQPDGRR
jgi:septin family protein